MIGAAVDELVVGLFGAEFVERDHLIKGGRLMQFAGGWLGVAIVVEAAAILGPIDLREAGPLQVIFQWFAGFDIEYVDLLPIAARLGTSVSEEATVFAGAERRHRNRAVFSPRVWVDQQAAFAFIRIGNVEHGL